LFGFVRDGFISGIDHKLTTTFFTLTFGFSLRNRTILDPMVRTTTLDRGTEVKGVLCSVLDWYFSKPDRSQKKIFIRKVMSKLEV